MINRSYFPIIQVIKKGYEMWGLSDDRLYDTRLPSDFLGVLGVVVDLINVEIC